MMREYTYYYVHMNIHGNEFIHTYAHTFSKVSTLPKFLVENIDRADFSEFPLESLDRSTRASL